MDKVEEYRRTLLSVQDWDEFLMAESALPGPRANLELIQAAADLGDEALFVRYVNLPADSAPTNSPQVFLTLCGVVGLGRLLSEGGDGWLEDLRRLASDDRWRVREAVAMALQRLGAKDMPQLLKAMQPWAEGSPLEQRAAAAALCEPRLLRTPAAALRVLKILDEITISHARRKDPRNPDSRVLAKALSYCWSVAVVALPPAGKEAMQRWLESPDAAMRVIMKENLRKSRLARCDPEWVRHWRRKLGMDKGARLDRPH
ncbi:MAG TPA: hypothetical protein VJ123_04230 [Anaerolineales bacterium]|nr:hypothetical protein [Anaerolineales bacterium]